MDFTGAALRTGSRRPGTLKVTACASFPPSPRHSQSKVKVGEPAVGGGGCRAWSSRAFPPAGSSVKCRPVMAYLEGQGELVWESGPFLRKIKGARPR